MGSLFPASRAAVAPQLAVRQSIPAETVATAIEEPPAMPPRQRTLFPQPVLQFEEFAPPASRPARARRTSPKRRSRRLERLEAAGQQRLELDPPAPPRPLQTKSGVQSAKYCHNPVALPVHRAMAGAVDLGLLGVASACFLGPLYILGGAALLETTPMAVLGTAAVAILLLYKVLWWLAGGDSPGMKCCRLQLLSFTGQRPTRMQRAFRFFGSLLSVASGGLGILWALGDEEKLAWHDHISKTFPSPRDF